MRLRTTVEELYRLYAARDPADTQRMELIEGEIVLMMPPAPLLSASNTQTNGLMTQKVGDAYRVRCKHPIRINRHNEPQPDIAVVKPRKDSYALSHPDPDDVLLIIEVSDTSLDFDLNAKRHTYAKAEIAEYWVLDVNSRELHVFLSPWEGDYTQHATHKGDDEVVCTTIADLKVSVRELLPAI
ncbi:Uma2 family endonuclease [Prosthecobacter sp.]|uniref:Uma2 family endonuclease n=1 Tax=Prosthecobacter sp. TaxID=1965333 RepID=UPI002629E891|nr:Uma2 family endonuclease [Prosthecobacter sp.]